MGCCVARTTDNEFVKANRAKIIKLVKQKRCPLAKQRSFVLQRRKTVLDFLNHSTSGKKSSFIDDFNNPLLLTDSENEEDCKKLKPKAKIVKSLTKEENIILIDKDDKKNSLLTLIKPIDEILEPKSEAVKRKSVTILEGLVVLMVGDRQCGKTCIVDRLFHKKFDDDYKKTESIAVTCKELLLDKKRKITFIDTPGLEAGENYITDNLDKANIIFCVYDSTGKI
jgi:hypothetical protein